MHYIVPIILIVQASLAFATNETIHDKRARWQKDRAAMLDERRGELRSALLNKNGTEILAIVDEQPGSQTQQNDYSLLMDFEQEEALRQRLHEFLRSFGQRMKRLQVVIYRLKEIVVNHNTGPYLQNYERDRQRAYEALITMRSINPRPELPSSVRKGQATSSLDQYQDPIADQLSQSYIHAISTQGAHNYPDHELIKLGLAGIDHHLETYGRRSVFNQVKVMGLIWNVRGMDAEVQAGLGWTKVRLHSEIAKLARHAALAIFNFNYITREADEAKDRQLDEGSRAELERVKENWLNDIPWLIDMTRRAPSPKERADFLEMLVPRVDTGLFTEDDEATIIERHVELERAQKSGNPEKIAELEQKITLIENALEHIRKTLLDYIPKEPGQKNPPPQVQFAAIKSLIYLHAKDEPVDPREDLDLLKRYYDYSHENDARLEMMMRKAISRHRGSPVDLHLNHGSDCRRLNILQAAKGAGRFFGEMLRPLLPVQPAMEGSK